MNASSAPKRATDTSRERGGKRGALLSSAAGFVLVLGLAACSVGPDFSRPGLPDDAGYAAGKPLTGTAFAGIPGGTAQRFIEAKDVPGQWWTLFHSPALDSLVNEALKANPNIGAAQAALRQAQETVIADRAAFFPTISGSGSATREKTSSASSASLGFPGAGTLSPFTVTTASLSVSYSPDVFGAAGRQAEAAVAQTEYARFQLEATYLSLIANVVNAAVTVASLRGQVAATEDIIRIETDQLNIVTQQIGLGAVGRSDVLSQEASLDQVRANLPPLRGQLAQARNQLMAYLGRLPSQDKGEDFDLASLNLPADLPLSLPSNLVAQRPDVRSAEAQLHAASANVGVAIANQLPQFQLTAQLGTSATSFAKLFTPGMGLWSLASSVTQTIFDAGAQEHRKRAAVAALDQAAAQYRGTVISAFQDVANALHAIENDADALKAQAAAERSALNSLDLSREQYRLGAINHLTLLNAEQTYQTAVVNRVRAQAARYSDTVALFQALGGGWWNRTDVPSLADVRSDRFVLPPIQEIKPANFFEGDHQND